MAGEAVVCVGAEQRGLYRKVAGDGEWTQLTRGLTPGAQVRALAVHPSDPQIVYAGTQRGVYKSTDRGDGWRRTNLPEGRVIWSLSFHPGDPKVMYAGTEGSELWTSRDGGDNWEYVATPTNPDTIAASWSPRIMSIAVDPAHPSTMYVAIEIGGVMRSDVPADLARALVWLSLSDELPRTAFGLITRANSYLSLPAKRFVEFVAQTLPGVLAARANAAGVPGPPRVTSGAARPAGP